ncbi:hypothetical protein ACFW1M_38440 [Streptomyces inhibens]|uniref:hypothetical protein n=1 Tax=Streptomyces inhibens TaxID=2293571 RepID=UPI0036751B4C
MPKGTPKDPPKTKSEKTLVIYLVPCGKGGGAANGTFSAAAAKKVVAKFYVTLDQA